MRRKCIGITGIPGCSKSQTAARGLITLFAVVIVFSAALILLAQNDGDNISAKTSGAGMGFFDKIYATKPEDTNPSGDTFAPSFDASNNTPDPDPAPTPAPDHAPAPNPAPSKPVQIAEAIRQPTDDGRLSVQAEQRQSMKLSTAYDAYKVTAGQCTLIFNGSETVSYNCAMYGQSKKDSDGFILEGDTIIITLPYGDIQTGKVYTIADFRAMTNASFKAEIEKDYKIAELDLIYAKKTNSPRFVF